MKQLAAAQRIQAKYLAWDPLTARKRYLRDAMPAKIRVETVLEKLFDEGSGIDDYQIRASVAWDLRAALKRWDDDSSKFAATQLNVGPRDIGKRVFRLAHEHRDLTVPGRMKSTQIEWSEMIVYPVQAWDVTACALHDTIIVVHPRWRVTASGFESDYDYETDFAQAMKRQIVKIIKPKHRAYKYLSEILGDK